MDPGCGENVRLDQLVERHQRVSSELLLLLTPLRQALERIERKALPLLNDPALLE
jgi:hypothetical protein